MTFEEMVAQLAAGTEAIGDVEAFSQQLQAEHQKVVDSYTSKLGVYETKIADLEKGTESLEKSIVDLKLTNYDLIQGKGVTGGQEPPVQQTPTKQGIDALFKVEE